MRKPAILGGEPAFKEPLHVGRPNLPDKNVFWKYVDRIFDSRWLTNNGPLVREFQEKLEKFLHVKYCVPVCNGTIALELAERALNFKDEVILPSYTFVATAHSLQWQRITPVFADISKFDVTIDSESIKKVLTPNTTGIIGVHVYGHPCDYKKIGSIADTHNINVLYDAAHSFGCEVDNIPIANLGRASVFSFHATKFFNSFEGGAVTTNDESLAEQIRLMTNFGFNGFEKDTVDYLGINGKMTEVSAAMGLAMLHSIESIRENNKQNFEKYREAITDIEGISLIEPPQNLTKHNWQYVIVLVDREQFGIDRDTLIQALEAENVLARRYFYPGCHQMQPYRECFPDYSLILPNTDIISAKVISFPTGQTIGQEEIIGIAECLQSISHNRNHFHG
ncbi:MAG: DegT/DnrJ/EryC1/StrS family aminotransferase [Candidatus Aegiribacteria sp.]|nr:DegT/DnrJ/EryC1/StrS family aminotransferase [Candidatus Aegiribacteria sp.]